MQELILTKGVISFSSAFFGKKSGELLKEKINTIDSRFYKIVVEVSETIQKKYPEVLGGAIDQLFTEKGIFEELIKVLYKKNKLKTDKIYQHLDKETLPVDFLDEFIKLLQEELLKDQLFDQLLSDIDMYDKINSIEELLKSNISIFEYENFVANYKTAMLNNISQINFFGLSLSTEVKKGRRLLEDIYVKPRFGLNTNAKADSEGQNKYKTDERVNVEYREAEEQEIREILESRKQILDFNELLDLVISEEKHLVILGNPGAGKSTLLKYIMFIIMSSKTENPLKEFLPFRIELRKYLIFKKDTNRNITDYVFENLISEYGAINIKPNNVQRILSDKKTIIFFDGLDEIFHINDKLSVKNDIINFLSTHENCKGVVTSRFIGYEEASFDNQFFNEIEMLEFDDRQIKSYVEKWYKETEKNTKIMNEEVKSFLELSKELDDELIRNPLSLSLIVILYRNNAKLPNSKLDIYRGCTNTLVEEWDDSKELKYELAIKKSKKSRVFTRLAYWQYIQQSEIQNGNATQITNTNVLNEVKNIIMDLGKIADDEFEAEVIGKEFLEFAEKRSIYFDNNFTHKTFHEYYTALWIYQNYEVKGNFELRNEIFRKYITNSYWSVVLELLLSLIDERQGDDDLIDELVEYQLQYSEDIKVYHFFLKTIPYMVNVGEETVVKIIRNSIKKCISLYSFAEFDGHIKENIVSPEISNVFSLISKLYSNQKYHSIIEGLLEELYDEYIRLDEPRLNFYLFIYELDCVLEKINKSEVEILARTNMNLYLKVYKSRNNYVEEVLLYIEYFGQDRLFEFMPLCFVNGLSVPYIYHYLHNEAQNKDEDLIRENFSRLISSGLDLKRFFDNMESMKRFWSRRIPVNGKERFEEIITEVAETKKLTYTKDNLE